MSSAGRGNRRTAFTLVEAIVSLVIVSVMLVAALETVGAARTTRVRIAENARGGMLADDLLTEILARAYEDPDLAEGSFGLGGEEANGFDRRLYDDVDDYSGWSASPPRDAEGVVIPDTDRYLRKVEVWWVTRSDFDIAWGTDTRLKRIRVTVEADGVPVAIREALKGAVDASDEATLQ